jgi:hypothetical protein
MKRTVYNRYVSASRVAAELFNDQVMFRVVVLESKLFQEHPADVAIASHELTLPIVFMHCHG